MTAVIAQIKPGRCAVHLSNGLGQLPIPCIVLDELVVLARVWNLNIQGYPSREKAIMTINLDHSMCI